MHLKIKTVDITTCHSLGLFRRRDLVVRRLRLWRVVIVARQLHLSIDRDDLTSLVSLMWSVWHSRLSLVKCSVSQTSSSLSYRRRVFLTVSSDAPTQRRF